MAIILILDCKKMYAQSNPKHELYLKGHGHKQIINKIKTVFKLASHKKISISLK